MRTRTIGKELVLSEVLDDLLKHGIRLPPVGVVFHALLQLGQAAIHNNGTAMSRPLLLDRGRQEVFLVVVVNGLLGA